MIVIFVLLLLIVPVRVIIRELFELRYNLSVSVWLFSTPVVVTVTVPLLLASVEFNTAPQLKALVLIALILGTVESLRNVIKCVVFVEVASESKSFTDNL